jgi:hypothetical protein
MDVFSSIRLQAAGWLAAVLLFSFLGILPANGEGVFVAAPSRVDVAYDNARGVLYISNGGELLRYTAATHAPSRSPTWQPMANSTCSWPTAIQRLTTR